MDIPQHLLYISSVLEKARDTIPKSTLMESGFHDFNFHGWDLECMADEHPMRFVGIPPQCPAAGLTASTSLTNNGDTSLEAADTGPATDPAQVELPTSHGLAKKSSPASHGLAGKSSPAHRPLAQSSSITKPSSPIRLPANESPEELLSSTIKASSPIPHSSTVAKHQSDATTTAPTNKSGPNPSTAKGSIAPTNIASGSKHQVQEVSPACHIAPITQCICQILPPPAAPLTKPSEVTSANKLTTGPRPAAPQSKGKSVSAEKEDSKHSSHLH